MRRADGSLSQPKVKGALCKQSKRNLGAKEVFMLNVLGQNRYLC